MGGKKSILVHLAPTVRAPVGCHMKPQSQLSLKVRGKVCYEWRPPWIFMDLTQLWAERLGISGHAR